MVVAEQERYLQSVGSFEMALCPYLGTRERYICYDV